MADRSGDNYALIAERKLINGGDYYGRVRVIYDTITTDGTETVSSKIYCGLLRPEDRVIGGALVFEGLGASTTLALGDAGDDDRFLAAVSTAAAGSADLRAMAGFGYRVAGSDTVPVCLTVGGATLTAGAQIRVAIYLVRD